MFSHPNSVGHDFVKQFPEIFKKYKPLYFMLPGQQMADFLNSSSFLFASKGAKDINLVFSAIQRAYGDSHKSFIDYLKERSSKRYQKLLCVRKKHLFFKNLDELWSAYNDQYGMRKTIYKFYSKNLTNKDKRVITSKMALQSSYKKKSRYNLDDRLKIRLEILVGWRDKLDHKAEYIPFSNGRRHFEYEINLNNKSYTLLSKLTFQEFYELTRKAMARFWKSKYKSYLRSGGKEKIEQLVDEILRQTKELNKRSKVHKKET